MSTRLPVLQPETPELQVERWFNTDTPLTLAGLRGRVVALHAFQMLCPGCVAHGLPQAQRMHALFAPEGLQVIGLHSVFEHHSVMERPEALEAFLHEYRHAFPVAADRPSGRVPETMRALGLRGTPSLLLIDRKGRLRLHRFGQVDDMVVGAALRQLLDEPPGETDEPCDAEGCRLPD